MCYFYTVAQTLFNVVNHFNYLALFLVLSPSLNLALYLLVFPFEALIMLITN